MTLDRRSATAMFMIALTGCGAASQRIAVEPVPMAALERMTPAADVEGAVAHGDMRLLGLAGMDRPIVPGVQPACVCGLVGASMIRIVDRLLGRPDMILPDSSLTYGAFFLSYVTQYNESLLERYAHGKVAVPTMYRGRSLDECAL